MRGRKIEQCGVVLLNKHMDKVLIVLQKESQKWGLPKGHMSQDEIERAAYFECAKRELFEETGIWLSFVSNKTIGTLIFQDKLFYMVQINRNEMWTQPIDKYEIERTMWLEIAQLEPFVKGQRCNSTLCRLSHEINTMYAAPTYNHRMLYALPYKATTLMPPPGFEKRVDMTRVDMNPLMPPPGFENIYSMTAQQLQAHISYIPFVPIIPYTNEWYAMQCAPSNLAPMLERTPYSSLPIHLQGLPFLVGNIGD